MESSQLGELLYQDTMFVGNLRGAGKAYLHVLIHTAPMPLNSHTLAKSRNVLPALIHNDVIPFYREHGLPVNVILTDNGHEFSGPNSSV